MNIFDNPKRYKDTITTTVKVPEFKTKKYNGKSFACVFFTKFCNAGCPFCFFKSDTRKYAIPQEKFEFSDYGFEKFISFINASNNGYILISGGGEPFEKENYVMETLKRAKTDRIVIVTSGIWAQNYDNAKRIIFQLYECIKNRNDDLKVVLRLSLDKSHFQQLGYDLVNNIINIFRINFSRNKNFELQIHTMINDDTIDNVIKTMGNCRKIDGGEIRVSDNEKLVKIVPKRCRILFEDGYEILVGMAKVFFPNLKVNLLNSNTVSRALSVFDEDMDYSEYNNPSVITNVNAQLGFDFWINYNGNITTWGNQQLDNLNNLYVDSYEKIISDLYGNIISYSFIDKGYCYRERVINEINSKAVLRSKAINIRDYAGALILEEHKTALYYSIRVIQDYLKAGVLYDSELLQLPEELQKVIKLSKKELINLYNMSEYNILSQYKDDDRFTVEQWLDIFTLIKLGHYDINNAQIANGLKVFNKRFGEHLTDLNNLPNLDNGQQYARLIERITFMKKEAIDLCMNRKEQKWR